MPRKTGKKKVIEKTISSADLLQKWDDAFGNKPATLSGEWLLLANDIDSSANALGNAGRTHQVFTNRKTDIENIIASIANGEQVGILESLCTRAIGSIKGRKIANVSMNYFSEDKSKKLKSLDSTEAKFCANLIFIVIACALLKIGDLKFDGLRTLATT